MVRLSGWVREQNSAGIEHPRITRDTVARITRIPRPGFRERALRVLAVIYARSSEGKFDLFGNTKTLYDLELRGRSYSRDNVEMNTLLRILEGEQLIKFSGENFSLSVKGLLQAEGLGSSQLSSSQGFVAMYFDDSLNAAWSDGFYPAITDAGFAPFHINEKDYVGGISDQIIAEIRRSRFVVADYTGQRQSVYFEAGFALGLGLTVIPTCRADEIEKLHFDIRHLNTVPWKTPEELAERLSKRIKAVIGIGPNAPA
jgi:hypothetical protein